MRFFCFVILALLSALVAPAQMNQLSKVKQARMPNWADSFGVVSPQSKLSFATPAVQHKATRQLLPQDFYTRNFGFFCRQELYMYKAGIPVSFRLGSMEDCNMLEQKGH